MRTKGLVWLALAGGLVTAVMAGPGLVDWNAWKPEIAHRASAALGRGVVLEGNLTLALLPHPTLSVAQIRLEGQGQGELLSLGRLDLQVAPWPLLAGRLEVQSLVLHQPRLTLEMQSDGRGNWETRSAAAVSANATPSGLPSGLEVRLDRVQVRGGSIMYRDVRTGRVEAVTGLDLSLWAETLAGPFHASGHLTVRDVPLQVEVAGGKYEPGPGLPLQMTLTGPGSRLNIEGLVKREGDGAPRIQGRVAVDVAAPATLLERLAPQMVAGLPAPLQQAVALQALATMDAAGLALTEMELQAGGAALAGTVRLRPGAPPTLSAAFTARKLVLDAWLAGDSGRTDGVKGAPPAPLYLPADLSADVTLAVDSLEWRGQPLRQVGLEAHLAGGTLTLDRAAARGPGGSVVGVTGRITTPGGQPDLDLRLNTSADSLHPVLEAMGAPLPQGTRDRLRRFALAARLQSRGEAMRLDGIDLQLDGSRATGQMSWAGGDPPQGTIQMAVDRLDLDAWLNAGRTLWPAAPALAPAAATVPVPIPVPALPDLRLWLTVKELVAGGAPLKDVAVDAALQRGRLILTQARVADLAGLAGDVRGEVASVAPLSGVALTFSLQGGSLAGLERLAGGGLPSLLHRLVPARLGGQVSGSQDHLAFDAVLDSGGGTIGVQGAVAPRSRAIAAPIHLHFAYPRTSQLLHLLLPDGASGARSVGEDSGATDLTLDLTGTPQEGLTLAVGPGTFAGTSLRGQGAAVLTGSRPSVQAAFQAGDINLDALLPRGGAGGKASAPAARSGTVVDSGASAGASAGTGAGAAVAAAKVPPPRGHWSTEPWNLSALSAVDAHLSLDAASLTTGGQRLGAPVLRLRLENGTLEVSQAEAELAGGRLQASGRLAAPAGGGTPALAATISLKQAQLARLGNIGAGPVAISGGTADGDITLNGRGQNQSALVESLGGQGSLLIRDGRVTGLGLAQLAERLGHLSRPQEALDLLSQGGQPQGETPFTRLEGTFTLARGVLTTRDLHLTAPLVDGEATATAALPPYTLDATARFRIRADSALPPFTVTLSGPLDRPERRFETKELQAYLMQRLGSRVLERVVPGLNLGPGGAGSATGSPARPADAVKGLFDRLRR